MILTPEKISAYKELICNPSNHGLQMQSINDFYEPSEQVTPKHILAKAYLLQVNSNVPKLILYIVMDELFGQPITDKEGLLGYKMRVKSPSASH